MEEKETSIIKETKSIKKSLVEKYGNNVLIMTKLGDFYEFFNDDAIIVSKIANLKLTKRNGNKENSPFMCGIPNNENSILNLIKKIINEGYILGIVEQYPDEKKGKKVFYRKLEKIITPGTFLNNDELNNYTCIIEKNKILFGDCFNGTLFINSFDNLEQIIDYLLIYKPKEIIFFNNNIYQEKVSNLFKNTFLLNIELNKFKELKRYENNENYSIISYYYNYIYGLFNTIPVVNDYNINKKFFNAITIKNLDIIGSENNYSLFSSLNKTITNIGKRFMKNSFLEICDKQEIEYRHSLVKFFSENNDIKIEIIKLITNINDTENILGKINNNRHSPQDLNLLKDGIKNTIDIVKIISKYTLFHKIISGINITILKDIYSEIDIKIKNGEGLFIEKTMFLKPFNENIKELYLILENKIKYFNEIEEKESLKLGKKVVIKEVNGKIYLDIRKGSELFEGYIKVRSLLGHDRYVTKEILEIEDKIQNAGIRLQKIEDDQMQIFRLKILEIQDNIKNMNNLIGFIDMMLSFSESIKLGYIIPKIGDRTILINMKNPIIYNFVDNYVSNDLNFNDKQKIYYLSFMNGGGKSTFLRAVGCNYLLFMIGSPVFADYSEMEIIDNIFSRVGSSDNLIKGESTFIRELNEVNEIILNCTDKSLILIDEFGRGTDNHSGIALCSGVLDFLSEKGIKSIFSTHYHELEKIVKEKNNISSYIVEESFDENGFIKFNYKLKEGFTSTSHGYEIAKSIGFIKDILNRAKNYL